MRSIQRRLASEGHSFESILNDIRRELAVGYLESSDRSITEIATDTGFSSLSSFERWFKAQFAMPPMKWRRLHCDDGHRTPSAA
jgi:AraC-like DNA-binding protein